MLNDNSEMNKYWIISIMCGYMEKQETKQEYRLYLLRENLWLQRTKINYQVIKGR